jgi:peptide-methionine (S)-S-oxide reductase
MGTGGNTVRDPMARSKRKSRRKAFRRKGGLCLGFLVAITLFLLPPGFAKEPAMDDPLETATLGMGCFWCSEAIFSDLKGVASVVSGYSGGTIPNPSYEQVCAGSTGHAEVVQITFDPRVISYDDLLRIFFHTHDPTTKNRQGADSGTQYRSVIFTHSEAQKVSAERIKAEAQKDWDKPIVTQIVPFRAFYKAEGYHQEFYSKNPAHPYCQVVIGPKMKKFQKLYEGKLKGN